MAIFDNMVGWLVSLALAVFVIACFHKLFLSIQGDKRGAFYGPNPTPEQLREASAWATDYLKRNPGAAEIVKFFPDEAKMADLLNRYENADFLYRTGHISETVYQAVVDDIAREIDVSEIVRNP